MDPDAKYLAGYLLGDGMIKHYRHSGYEVKLTEKDERHAHYLADLMARVLEVKPSVSRDKRRNAMRIRVFRKSAYEKARTLVETALKEPDPHLIGGLFDAEGDYTDSKRRIRFTNKDSNLVRLVVDYLRENGVLCHVYVRRRGKSVWFIVEVYGKHAFRLLSLLDLRHPKWSKIRSSR